MSTPIRPRPNQQLMTHLPLHLTCYRLSEVAQMLNCSYTYIYRLVRDGSIPSIRVQPTGNWTGRRRPVIRIPATSLMQLMTHTKAELR